MLDHSFRPCDCHRLLLEYRDVRTIVVRDSAPLSNARDGKLSSFPNTIQDALALRPLSCTTLPADFTAEMSALL